MNLMAKAVLMVRKHEDSVNHLYLDNHGNVTCAMGKLVETVQEALTLDWRTNATGSKATPEQIEAEYNRIKGAPKNYRATWYRSMCQLHLTDEAINETVQTDLLTVVTELSREFPGFAEFPEPAQLGLVDMAYNLGIGTLTHSFPSFCKAVRNRDWKTCAIECHRKEKPEYPDGIPAERNAETKALFETAA